MDLHINTTDVDIKIKRKKGRKRNRSTLNVEGDGVDSLLQFKTVLEGDNCSVCGSSARPEDGEFVVKLHFCHHHLCRTCLFHGIQLSNPDHLEFFEIRCPYDVEGPCGGTLMPFEIDELLPVYNEYTAKSDTPSKKNCLGLKDKQAVTLGLDNPSTSLPLQLDEKDSIAVTDDSEPQEESSDSQSQLEEVVVPPETNQDLDVEAMGACAAQSEEVQIVVQNGDWICSVCSLINTPDQTHCDVCTSERPLCQSARSQQGYDPDREFKLMLYLMDRHDAIPNVEPFICSRCSKSQDSGDGVVLRECLHQFCKDCLINTVETSQSSTVKCPYRDEQTVCQFFLEDREIKALVPAPIYERHIAKSGWSCRLCTLVNAAEAQDCGVCNSQLLKEQLEGCSGETNQKERQRNYQLLLYMDNYALIPNTEQFDCVVCLSDCEVGEGVVLHECLHTFCKECLINTVRLSEDAEIRCPYGEDKWRCDGFLLDYEIKALVSVEIYEKHLSKSLTLAESTIPNSFHCKAANCPGWGIIGEEDTEVICPVCKRNNCITCQVVHPEGNCAEYQARLQRNQEARQTQTTVNKLIRHHEAMRCPRCRTLVSKDDGCDGLTCTVCKTDICWITKQARWGPKGKGDYSGGCRCNWNGRKCHPNCSNCH